MNWRDKTVSITFYVVTQAIVVSTMIMVWIMIWASLPE